MHASPSFGPMHCSGVLTMPDVTRRDAWALVTGGVIALSALSIATGNARAAEQPVKRSAAHPRPVRTVARTLTIRRHIARPVDVVGTPGFAYVVPQHRWTDPRLYYFGPFRTGGEVFYGDQAGRPITRGNSELGMISGYGGARGGFGGPHFDSVGGFHNGPGPTAKIDDDYASGSLSRPDYGDIEPRYPGARARAAALNEGVVPRGSLTPVSDRAGGRSMVAEGRSTFIESEDAKARFGAPMVRANPDEGLPGGQPLPTLGDIGDF
jgi:hypothetical protein